MAKTKYAKSVDICMIISELVNRGLIEEATRTLKIAGFIHKSEFPQIDYHKLAKAINDDKECRELLKKEL